MNHMIGLSRRLQPRKSVPLSKSRDKGAAIGPQGHLAPHAYAGTQSSHPSPPHRVVSGGVLRETSISRELYVARELLTSTRAATRRELRAADATRADAACSSTACSSVREAAVQIDATSDDADATSDAAPSETASVTLDEPSTSSAQADATPSRAPLATAQSRWSWLRRPLLASQTLIEPTGLRSDAPTLDSTVGMPKS